ncbi:MAG: hypothetical protein MI922_04355, partial [Bacteroidales bacterium]|nr:hypothetical protein [Bacteroidales bacterium]
MKKCIFLLLTFMILSVQNTWSNPTKQEVYELAKYWYSFDNHVVDSIAGDTLIANNVSFANDGERGLVAQLIQGDTSGMESTKRWVQTEEYTVSTWLYVDMATYPVWNQIWEFHNDVNGRYQMLTGKIAWEHHFGTVSDRKAPQGWKEIFSGQEFPLNRWVHVVMSFNYGNVALYLDGAEVATGNTVNLVDTIAPNRFFIGGFNIPGRKGNGLNCKLDDFAVFDYVLTPAEVLAVSKDTLAASPDVAPYVFEAEDYAFGDWLAASEGDTSYAHWNGDRNNEASNENSMLFGTAKGVGTFVLWAKVKADAGIKAPLFLKIDDGNWVSIDTVAPNDKYKWVKLYQTPNLENGDHVFRIAPGTGGVKIDKFLYTRDWDYDPETEFTKTDLEAPTVPSSIATSNVSVHDGTLSWNASTDNTEVIAYDVYESGRIITVTTSLSYLFDAMASSDYSWQVRAKDAQGNVSALSAAKDISTDDLIFTIDFNQEKQTVHHFGASDAWAVDNLYKWPLAKRQDMAEKLFTTENDTEGNPKGIGLSMWRFHIGDGSLDQTNSGYATGGWYKELECFRAENGTYDWNKQKGSMWFMQQAKSYGVNSYTAWINSPPYYMTENGYTFRTDGVSGYNLQTDKFDDFAEFLATVTEHLIDSGYNIEVLSPVNEPQFQWKWKVGEAAQSGSYCSNADLYTLGFNLNTKLKQKGLSTKIMLTEAGSLGPLFKNTGNAAHSDQIDYFWNNNNSTSLAQLSN